MSDERALFYPVNETFSRQQVHERTGIADDVLAFWIKQGLLIPLPAERRAHRRFTYQQLHIAAVLNAMRSLGANIGILRKFAAALQDGFVTWSDSGLEPEALWPAISLCVSLDKLSRGERVEVQASADDYRRSLLATNESELIQGWLWEQANEGVTLQLADFAKMLTIQEAHQVKWALGLTEPSHLWWTSETNRESAWIAWIDDAGNPQIADDDEVILDSETGPLAAFYIPIGRLIRRLWPDRIERAHDLHRIQRHNAQIAHLTAMEKSNPRQAAILRERADLPDNWAETYKIIGEDSMDG